MIVGRKIGRRANGTIRRQAQHIVDAYRPVADCPDGEFLNGLTMQDRKPYLITHSDALNIVLRLLEEFAKTGTFERLESSRRTLMMYEILELQERGVRRKDIIEKIMPQYNLSKSHLVIHKSDSKLMAPKIPVYIQ